MHFAQSVIQARLSSAESPHPTLELTVVSDSTWVKLHLHPPCCIIPVTDSLVSDSFQGIVNPNGPIILGRMRDTEARAIQWNPATGESIHGSLQVLKGRFRELVRRAAPEPKLGGKRPREDTQLEDRGHQVLI
jgi:hypothetical protein